MSFQPSKTESIKTLFHGNRFIIPSYQRKFSWRYDQYKALWDDIAENLDMKHFIGTLCFQKNDAYANRKNDAYEVIDGQQRLTTLYILLNVLIERLENRDAYEDYMDLYIGNKDLEKLLPQGQDSEFIKKLIFDFGDIDPEQINIRSQLFLYYCKRDFKSLSEEFTQDHLTKWIDYITQKIEVLIFNVEDHSQAVKMFSVINDRGLPLSNLDKTKSVLMLYSTVYLDEKLNDQINERFGKIFDFLDNALIKKEKLKMFRTLDEMEFENMFYTHHYYSSRKRFDGWDYNLGALSIFKQLKKKCESLKEDPDDLSAFIMDYIKDFDSFAKSYSDLFDRIYRDNTYSILFQYLEFTATLYPLIVRLNKQGKLDGLLDILEIAEVRVYKLKNTNPRRNMYLLASEIEEQEYSEAQIREKIKEFVVNFLNDYRLKEYLNDGVDRKIPLVRYLLYRYNLDKYKQNLSLDEYRNLQVEHIFSSNPNFDVLNYGFLSRENYDVKKSIIGNLTILEKGLNKKVSNIPPDNKQTGYQESKVLINNHLMAKLDTMNLDYLVKRNDDLIEFCKEAFPIN